MFIRDYMTIRGTRVRKIRLIDVYVYLDVVQKFILYSDLIHSDFFCF